MLSLRLQPIAPVGTTGVVGGSAAAGMSSGWGDLLMPQPAVGGGGGAPLLQPQSTSQPAQGLSPQKVQ